MDKILYKYIRSKYVNDLINGGDIPLRNLTYFQMSGDEARGDLFEGRHIDRPGSGVVVEEIGTGVKVEGDLAFVNSVDEEGIYVYCLSEVHTLELYEEFDADACVEIRSSHQFVRDIRTAVKKLRRSYSWKVVSGKVNYYRENEPARKNIKDPDNLPFFKPNSYFNQKEYRVVVAKKKSLQLTQRIVIGDKLGKTEQPDGKEPSTVWLNFPRGSYMKVHYKRDFGSV